jgi:hypothetical protein
VACQASDTIDVFGAASPDDQECHAFERDGPELHFPGGRSAPGAGRGRRQHQGRSVGNGAGLSNRFGGAEGR